MVGKQTYTFCAYTPACENTRPWEGPNAYQEKKCNPKDKPVVVVVVVVVVVRSSKQERNVILPLIVFTLLPTDIQLRNWHFEPAVVCISLQNNCEFHLWEAWFIFIIQNWDEARTSLHRFHSWCTIDIGWYLCNNGLRIVVRFFRYYWHRFIKLCCGLS